MGRLYAFRWLLLLLLPIFGSAFAEDGTSTTARLAVNPATLALQVGQLATVQLSNVNGSLRVQSSNTNVATAVISSGALKVTAKAAGSTTLTVQDSRNTAKVTVTVTAPKLSVNTQSLPLMVGQKGTVNIANAVGTVTATMANTKVATATLSGSVVTVTAKAAGSTTMTVKDSRTSVTVQVTVTAASLSASPMALTLTPAQKGTVSITNASGTVTAVVTNANIATATLSGSTLTVTGKVAGSTQVTVRDSKYAVVISVTVSSAVTPPPVMGGSYTLVAWNDLGMHCMDGRDYSVFSILPPYNTLHAQLIDTANNKVVNQGVTLTYQAMADPSGSINTISSTKTNFWSYVQALFGASPAPDVGLTGNKAPSVTPFPLTYNASMNLFEAVGIPLTPYDDSLAKNFYPMVLVVARDSTGTQLAQARVVLPVSDEMSCASCHAANSSAAAKPSTGWIVDPNKEIEWKKNILSLHDQKQAGDSVFQAALNTMGYSSGLLASATNGKPVLCASCHSSNALGTAGAAGVEPLTQALHSRHTSVTDPSTGLALNSSSNRDACYLCHPGSQTKCLRGVMGNALDASGNMAIQCQSCHGAISNVGKAGRVGWMDEPNCQSCHHDGQREVSAVDSSGNLKAWLDTTFATNANEPVAPFSLYRFSSGHGGLQCEACHGATHAEYPTSHPNDNLLSMDVQGHEGTIAECTACHKTVPTTVNGGPHGMHTVGQAWVSSHKSAAKSGTTTCAYCHGADFRGTPLSATKVSRSLSVEGGTKTFPAGHQFNCYDCHNGPNGG